MTSQNLRRQHKLLGLIIDRENAVEPTRYLYINLYDEDSKILNDDALPDYTNNELANVIGLSQEQTYILLGNLCYVQLIKRSPHTANGYIPTDTALYTYEGHALIHRAHELDEEAHKEKLANSLGISNLIVAILTLLIAIAGMFYVAPLQKEKDRLSDTLELLRLENQQLRLYNKK